MPITTETQRIILHTHYMNTDLSETSIAIEVDFSDEQFAEIQQVLESADMSLQDLADAAIRKLTLQTENL